MTWFKIWWMVVDNVVYMFIYSAIYIFVSGIFLYVTETLVYVPEMLVYM
jgi:hypothetical protein